MWQGTTRGREGTDTSRDVNQERSQIHPAGIRHGVGVAIVRPGRDPRPHASGQQERSGAERSSPRGAQKGRHDKCKTRKTDKGNTIEKAGDTGIAEPVVAQGAGDRAAGSRQPTDVDMWARNITRPNDRTAMSKTPERHRWEHPRQISRKLPRTANDHPLAVYWGLQGGSMDCPWRHAWQ